jgi:2-C-methyl-D-erythritol 4-phosphate cytidylyltransferase
MNVAIIVAAGKGTRLGNDRPKQFIELAGTPILVHTLRQFERCREIDDVIVVLPADQTAGFQSLARDFQLQKLRKAIAGGASRAQSVSLGLAAIAQAEIVAVHDGVRPFVTAEEIDLTMQRAKTTGAAILAAEITDTIKEVEAARVIRTAKRTHLRRALTPQCFRFEILSRAYEQLAEIEAAGVEVTDDSLLVERLGIPIAVVEGSARNIKITTHEDLALAELFIKKSEVSNQKSEVRDQKSE